MRPLWGEKWGQNRPAGQPTATGESTNPLKNRLLIASTTRSKNFKKGA
jgi:hypothetical protein